MHRSTLHSIPKHSSLALHTAPHTNHTNHIDICTNPLCSIKSRKLPWSNQLATPFVTWSREMSHLSKNSISIFLHQCLTTSKCFILMQTPLRLDIRLQSYEEFDNAKNNMKQRNLNPVYANISKTTSPTSPFLLIMSHLTMIWPCC